MKEEKEKMEKKEDKKEEKEEEGKEVEEEEEGEKEGQEEETEEGGRMRKRRGRTKFKDFSSSVLNPNIKRKPKVKM